MVEILSEILDRIRYKLFVMKTDKPDSRFVDMEIHLDQSVPLDAAAFKTYSPYLSCVQTDRARDVPRRMISIEFINSHDYPFLY
jgi:hypothetical protein